jgi:DNA-binding beta-propeller fold protein YncE
LWLIIASGSIFAEGFITLSQEEKLFNLNTPAGVAIDKSGNLYVTNFYKKTIKKFKPDGTLIAEWECKQNELYSPYGIAVDAGGNIFV